MEDTKTSKILYKNAEKKLCILTTSSGSGSQKQAGDVKNRINLFQELQFCIVMFLYTLIHLSCVPNKGNKCDILFFMKKMFASCSNYKGRGSFDVFSLFVFICIQISSSTLQKQPCRRHNRRA